MANDLTQIVTERMQGLLIEEQQKVVAFYLGNSCVKIRLRSKK